MRCRSRRVLTPSDGPTCCSIPGCNRDFLGVNQDVERPAIGEAARGAHSDRALRGVDRSSQRRRHRDWAKIRAGHCRVRKNRVGEVDPLQLSAGEVRTRQINTGEISSRKCCAAEVRALTDEIPVGNSPARRQLRKACYRSRDHTGQVRIREIGPCQGRTLEIDVGQIRRTKICVLEVHSRANDVATLDGIATRKTRCGRERSAYDAIERVCREICSVQRCSCQNCSVEAQGQQVLIRQVRVGEVHSWTNHITTNHAES